MRRSAFAALLALAAAAGCASAPAPGTCAIHGAVRLVPRAGVTPAPVADSSYGDPRLRDVVPVDYDRPGFCVVWVEGLAPPRGPVALAIEARRPGPRLEPAGAAVGVGGRVTVRNDDAVGHAVSCPAGGLLRRLEPGASATIEARGEGPLTFFVLDAPGVEATVFAAPGPFAIPDAAGDFRLDGLPPCRGTLRAWHPRFPARSRPVRAKAGEDVRADVEIGVDALAEGR